MARWHTDEAQRSRLCDGAEDAKKSGEKGIGEGGGVLIQLAVDECRNEMIDRVTINRNGFD